MNSQSDRDFGESPFLSDLVWFVYINTLVISYEIIDKHKFRDL